MLRERQHSRQHFKHHDGDRIHIKARAKYILLGSCFWGPVTGSASARHFCEWLAAGIETYAWVGMAAQAGGNTKIKQLDITPLG